MIDYTLLERLWNSARSKKDGKPLDKKRSVCGNYMGRGNYMRHVRLFKLSDGWRFQMYRTDIAIVQPQSDGSAIITVDPYACVTTADRLSSILERYVCLRGNALRLRLDNMGDREVPLSGGTQLRMYGSKLDLLTPTSEMLSKKKVNREKAKPINEALARLHKVGNAMLRVGAGGNWDEIIGAYKAFGGDPEILEPEHTLQHVLLAVAFGIKSSHSPWYLKTLAEFHATPTIATTWNEASAPVYFERGLGAMKRKLFEIHGVWDTVTEVIEFNVPQQKEVSNA